MGDTRDENLNTSNSSEETAGDCPLKCLKAVVKKYPADKQLLEAYKNVSKNYRSKLSEINDLNVRTVDLINDKEILMNKLHASSKREGALEKDLEKVESELNLCRGKLRTRPYLETVLEEVIPSWIRSLKNMCQKNKLAVSLLFKLTASAVVLMKRKDDSEEFIEIETIADSLDILWTSFSRKVSHNNVALPVVLSEEEWDALLENVQIELPAQQFVIKKMLVPIDQAELRVVKKVIPEDTFTLYVNHLDIDVNRDGEYESIEKIEKVCGSFKDKLLDFFFPKQNRKFTNEVFIKTNIRNSVDLDSLKTKLNALTKPNSEIFYRNNYIHRG